MSDIVKILKEKNLVDFFETYLKIDLQKTGKNYCCPCPIHEDTAPSFYIDPVKNKCACYGRCNFNGDIIDFVMKWKNLTFPEGVGWLAEKYKLSYKKSQSKHKEEFSEYYEICNFVMNFYKDGLNKSYTKEGRQYLSKRKISQTIISEFNIGVASTPSDLGTWCFLTDELKKQNFNLELAEKIGLTRKSEKGTYYDFFFGRIIIPIFDLKDRCIGFNSRYYTVPPGEKDIPKYLLTKETPIFKKNQFIFGLNKSLKYIKSESTCYVVEGCFDYFRMFDYGYRNTIPLLGGKILKDPPDVDNYIFLMDPDKAGIKYSLENGKDLISKQKTVMICELKKDPDDCTKDEIEKTLISCFSYLDFYLKHNYKYNSIEHKLKIIDGVCELFKGISKDQLYMYVPSISEKLQIPSNYVLYRFGLDNKTFLELFKELQRG
jgi:DNA primase